MYHHGSKPHIARFAARSLGAVALAFAILMALLPTAPAAGGSARQSSGDEDPLQIFRAPLLREGSMLVEAHAVLRRQGEPAWWTLHVEPRDASIASSGLNGGQVIAATTVRPPPASELVVLPCTRLSEMERIIENVSADESRDVHFKVSGRVFVFRDRNYFLPTHAAVVSAESTAPPTSNPAESQPVSAAHYAPLPADDDSAEAIARALEQQAGPIARSSAATRAAESRPSSQNPIATDAIGRDLAVSDRGATLQENTAVVNRRGKITRDRSGGWLLVFDADASGLADPPLKLMPCMLLENIEDYARRVGNNSPIIITGQVYLYSGQNHLLPTVYRIPRETSRLTP